MNAPINLPVSRAEIEAAAARIEPHAHRTPLFTCRTIDTLAGAEVVFKAENLQRIGAFKFRGAMNAVYALSPEQAARGVATHSSGNHAQAVALAARMRGIPAVIVMPSNAPGVKVAAVRGYGATVRFCEPTQQAREETLSQVVAETGAAFIHPFDNLQVIAGQATCARELLQDRPDLNLIITPVGGGGLLSGTALACHYFAPQVAVAAGEPAGADDTYRSFTSGVRQPVVKPQTIADGLLTSVGEITFPVIKALVRRIVLVTDDEIRAAMRLILERMKLVVEPSAAVPLAALLKGDLQRELRGAELRGADGKGAEGGDGGTAAGVRIDGGRALRVGVILSGGNVDLATVAREL